MSDNDRIDPRQLGLNVSTIVTVEDYGALGQHVGQQNSLIQAVVLGGLVGSCGGDVLERMLQARWIGDSMSGRCTTDEIRQMAEFFDHLAGVLRGE